MFFKYCSPGSPIPSLYETYLESAIFSIATLSPPSFVLPTWSPPSSFPSPCPRCRAWPPPSAGWTSPCPWSLGRPDSGQNEYTGCLRRMGGADSKTIFGTTPYMFSSHFLLFLYFIFLVSYNRKPKLQYCKGMYALSMFTKLTQLK